MPRLPAPRLPAPPLPALTIALLLAALPAQAEGLFAAIAFSPATGMSGGAWNHATETLAETEAYGQCGAEDCDTVLVFQQCGAIAVGDGFGMGYGSDLSTATANDLALQNCDSYTTNCAITMSFCNEGY